MRRRRRADGQAHDAWWYRPGSRQSPEAFACGEVPLLRCLTDVNLDKDILHIVMRTLTALQHDGHVAAEALFDRLNDKDVAPEGWTALLLSFSGHGIESLLKFAAASAADGHLSRERCPLLSRVSEVDAPGGATKYRSYILEAMRRLAFVPAEIAAATGEETPA